MMFVKIYALVDSYLTYLHAIEKSDMTVATNRRTLCRILEQLEDSFGVRIDDAHVEGLDASVLYAWYAALNNSGCKMTTKNLYVILLNGFLRWIYTLNHPSAGKIVISDDWSNILKCGKVKKESDLPPEMQKVRTLTTQQVVQLIQDCSGANAVRDRAFLALMSGTGMRASEVCSLNLSSYVRIREQQSVLVCRKGGNWAVVEVPNFVLPFLDEYVGPRLLGVSLDDMPAQEKSQLLDEPLFLTTHGNRVSQNNMYKSIRRRQEMIGAPVGLHNFRHTVVSAADRVGGSGVARDIAGHKSLVVTNRYNHTTREDRADTVNALPWAQILAEKK